MGSVRFAIEMMNRANVAVAPGAGFGEEGDGWLRLALVENENRIRQALKQMRQSLKEIDQEVEAGTFRLRRRCAVPSEHCVWRPSRIDLAVWTAVRPPLGPDLKALVIAGIENPLVFLVPGSCSISIPGPIPSISSVAAWPRGGEPVSAPRSVSAVGRWFTLCSAPSGCRPFSPLRPRPSPWSNISAPPT
jgi:hypothetical protein